MASKPGFPLPLPPLLSMLCNEPCGRLGMLPAVDSGAHREEDMPARGQLGPL